MSQSNTNRSYRAIFILDTRELQDSLESLTKKIKEILMGLEAKVLGEVNLGLRPFARAVDKKFPAGHYFQIEFQGNPRLPAAIKERFRLDKMINRIFIQNI